MTTTQRYVAAARQCRDEGFTFANPDPTLRCGSHSWWDRIREIMAVSHAEEESANG